MSGFRPGVLLAALLQEHFIDLEEVVLLDLLKRLVVEYRREFEGL